MPEELLDFSANINPLGLPDSIKRNWGQFMQGLEQYPDPKASNLKEKLANREGIAASQLIIGNGGSELISLVGRLLAGKRVLIVQPAFSEYESVCRTNKAEVSYFLLEENWEMDILALKKRLSHVDALFLCNPSNPTGAFYDKGIIRVILEECKKQHCTLIIDEAFYDFVPGYESLVPLVKEDSPLIILRSLTKMFSIPGLRLGYAMASPETIKELSSYQPHWSVNSIALKVGELCIEEEAYIEKTLEYIMLERKGLVEFYKNNDFIVSASKVNFYLLRDPHQTDQYPLFQFLLQKGIVPRHTFNFPGLEGRWLRFAIKSIEENKTLMEVLQEWRRIHPSSS